jgi:integrase
MASGVRTLLFEYTLNGSRRMRIGDAAAWLTEDSRAELLAEVLRLRKLVDQGVDPQAERKKQRDEPTLGELVEHDHAVEDDRLRDATKREYRSEEKRDILPAFGDQKTSEIKTVDGRTWHRKLTVSSGPYRANRSLSRVKRIINVAIRDGLITCANPFKGVAPNPEHPRQPSLSAGDFKRLLRALDTLRPGWEDEDAVLSAVIKIAIFTGCRIGEAYSARWPDLDLQARTWDRPHTSVKQKAQSLLPLNSVAWDQFSDLHRRAPKDEAGNPASPWVFPSRAAASGHLVSIRQTWKRALREAGLQDRGLRLHDMRHNFGGFLAGSGLGLPIIGSLLGHRLARTTQRYAAVQLSPARAASELFADHVADLMRHDTAAIVDLPPPLRRKGGD